jgi:hypothetical protein
MLVPEVSGERLTTSVSGSKTNSVPATEMLRLKNYGINLQPEKSQARTLPIQAAYLPKSLRKKTEN